MSKKSFSTLKLSAAAAILVAGLGVNGITSEAVFDAPYYNITTDGGSFNGSQYVLNGATVTDSFFCDGTYTYFLQTDGTPMKDRLTYHPDGKQVIYFDENGHECFDTFAHVKKSISGDAVDDLCYFGTTGNLYVNVITYNREGTAIYYANKYGVMERNGVFEVSSEATNYSALANGCKYGYANSDGTVKGFYATYEEAATVYADENGYAEGHIGDIMVNCFFDYTVKSAYTCKEFEGYKPSEGNKLLVADVTVHNITNSSIPMFDTDFQVQWGDDADDAYNFPITYYGNTVSTAQLPKKYDLAVNESKTGLLVFEVPEDANEYAVSYLERFADGTVGDAFFVYFTAQNK